MLKASKGGSGSSKGGATTKGSKDRKTSINTVGKEKGSKDKNRSRSDTAGAEGTAPITFEEERFLKVTIETLRNIKTRIPGREITIHVEDVGEFKYDSPVIELEESETTLNWTFEFPCFPSKSGWFDEFAANPLLFTLFELVQKENKEKEKTGNKKESKTSHVEQPPKEELVIGNCTLDLLPLLLGEKRIRQVLLVEQDFDAYGHELMTWPNLPQLTVCATIEETLVSEQDVKESNMLFITLESLYNLSANMSEDLVYRAATSLPYEYNKSRDVMFNVGLWTDERGIDQMKRWIGFANVGGRGAYSSYRLERDVKSLKNYLKVDVEKKMNQEAPRVEWNTLRRAWLSSSESESIQSYISTHRWWPLEMLIEENPLHQSDSKGKLRESLDMPTSLHLAAYFDVSALLYPGVTKVRAISQVYTFCQEDMLGRCGLSRSLFAPALDPDITLDTPTSSTNIKKKDKPKVADQSSSKSFSKKSSSKEVENTSSVKMTSKKASIEKKLSLKEKSSKVADKELDKTASKGKANKKASKTPTLESASGSKLVKSVRGASEIVVAAKEQFSAPLFSEDGQPVFILFELELFKPFREKRPVEEAVKNLDETIHEGRGKLPVRVMTPELAETHFRECIQSISGKITTEYQKYLHLCGVDECGFLQDSVAQDKFYKHLQDSGVYQSIKETLRNKITDLMREKMGYGFNITEREELKVFLSDAYVYLIEQVHTIINSMLDAGAPDAITPIATDEDLYYFAKEACEQNKYDTAEKIFELLINNNKENPVWWLEFAVYHMGQSNWMKAAQLALEALSLDGRNQLGLLIYALVMSELGEEKTAFVFFDALTSIYPSFMEGWLTYHLYNLKTKRHSGAAATLQYAEKCSTSVKDDFSAPVVDTEPIAWSSKAFPPDRSIFLQTSVLLLKLNATFYAELALAQEYMYDGRSLEYAYYLAVSHYLEGRYADAMVHLQEALVGHRKQMSLWALMGHCHFKLKDVENTLEHYNFIVDSGEDIADLHMITLRLADYSLRNINFEKAKMYYLLAAKHRSTPCSWFGAAIACYNMNEFFEAEKLLMEANLLDNTCPKIWAYLTLVNLHFHRQTEFELCYSQAIKNNLRDQALLQRIRVLQESLKYPDPCPLRATGDLHPVKQTQTEDGSLSTERYWRSTPGEANQTEECNVESSTLS